MGPLAPIVAAARAQGTLTDAVAAKRAVKAPPGHETLVQRAQATVVAEWAPEEALVERVARAMADDRGMDFDSMDDPTDVDWFDVLEKGWWRSAARAAIEAMGGGDA